MNYETEIAYDNYLSFPYLPKDMLSLCVFNESDRGYLSLCLV